MIAVRPPRVMIALCLVALTGGMVLAEKPSLLRMFGRPNASPLNASQPLELTEEEGPWLILASTFVGQGAKNRAERLAKELREEMKMPAFIYKEEFDFTGTINNDVTSSKKLRYANRYQYDAYAVLVGEYDTTEHPSIERDLKRIRSANPSIFQDQNELTAETDRSNPVTTVKSITAKLFRQGADGTKKGPMSQAFVTRNPMLPEEYFSAPQVDSSTETVPAGN